MKKYWRYRNREYIMIWYGKGKYSLNGYHCTDSEIWDYATDCDNNQKRKEVRIAAERFVSSKMK